MSAKDWFKDFGRGAALGTGILPGVSVGTIGLIVNVYDRLLGYINGLRKKFKESFLGLLPIALGCIVLAVFLLWGYGKLTKWRSQTIFEVVMLFAGVVIGGVPLIIKGIDRSGFNAKDAIRVALGIIIAAGIGIMSVVSKVCWNIDISSAFMDPFANWWVYIIVAVAGIVAAVACLLPGISGSMVLFIFGVYSPVVGLLTDPETSILHSAENRGARILLVGILFFGVVGGLFATSKVMAGMMEKHHQGTYTLVLGFILGSLVSMLINCDMWDVYATLTPWDYVIGTILLIVGVLIIAGGLRLSNRKRKQTE